MLDFFDWQERSVEFIDPQIEIYFELSEKGKGFKNFDVSRRNADQVSTLECIDHVEKLIDYFQSEVASETQKGKKFSDMETLFWLRFLIRDRCGEIKYTFDWYDHMDEISRFAEWVLIKNESEDYNDMDQHWGLIGAHRRDRVYLLEYDPDHEVEVFNSFIMYDVFCEQLKLALSRAVAIVGRLSTALGEDVWSKYRGYEWDRVVFGTSDWQP